MKILILIDETPYYHPKFVMDLHKVLGEQICGVALVTKILKKHSLAKFIKTKIRFLKVGEVIRTGLKNFKIFREFLLDKKDRNHYRVESVLIKQNTPYIIVKNDINQKRYIDWMKEKNQTLSFLHAHFISNKMS